MAWLILAVAGILEIVWAYYMKLSDGFTRVTPSIVTLGAMFLSFGLLALAMKSLPLGTAYTVWTGIGAVGTFVVGIVVLGGADCRRAGAYEGLQPGLSTSPPAPAGSVLVALPSSASNCGKLVAMGDVSSTSAPVRLA